MPVTINGDGSITGLAVGGLPDGCVDTDTLANGAASGSKITMPSGSVIQTKSTSFSGTNNITIGSANTFYELDDFNVTITSTVANSKFLVSFNFVPTFKS